MDNKLVLYLATSTIPCLVGGFVVGYIYGKRGSSSQTDDSPASFEGFEVVNDDSPVDYTKFSKINDKLREIAKKRGIDDDLDKNRTIRIVREDEADKLALEPVSITYFSDGVFFDDHAVEKVVNPNEVFGPNIQNRFGEGSGNLDVVYVANQITGSLYQITRVKAEYRVAILGEEPPGKQKTTKTRRDRRKVTTVEKFTDDDDDWDQES